MRVGVTGHQDIGTLQQVAWVTAALRVAVQDNELTAGATSLAAGTDQLYASLLNDCGKPYAVIIPCEHYEDTFDTTHELYKYHMLFSKAESIIQLPYSTPTEEAFLQAGKRVVDISDYMLAVWDGQPAKGLGGTADIVQYCLKSGKHVVHINPNTRSVHKLD